MAHEVLEINKDNIATNSFNTVLSNLLERYNEQVNDTNNTNDLSIYKGILQDLNEAYSLYSKLQKSVLDYDISQTEVLKNDVQLLQQQLNILITDIQSKLDNGDFVGTTDYNNLQNKPVLSFLNSTLSGQNVKLYGHRISCSAQSEGFTLDLVGYENYNFCNLLVSGYSSHSSLSNFIGIIRVSKYGIIIDATSNFNSNYLLLEEHPDHNGRLRMRVLSGGITGFSIGFVPFGSTQLPTYYN